jgi:hypothetical protein
VDTATPCCAAFAVGFSFATVGDATGEVVRMCDPCTPLRTVAREMKDEQVQALVTFTVDIARVLACDLD